MPTLETTQSGTVEMTQAATPISLPLSAPPINIIPVASSTCVEWYIYDILNLRAYNINEHPGSNTVTFNASPLNTVENIAPTSFYKTPMSFYGFMFNNLAGVTNLYAPTGVPQTLQGTPFDLGLRSASARSEYHGLGIAGSNSAGVIGDPEGEVNPNQMVQIDTAAAKAANPNAADLLIRVGSVQVGQSYAFYGSNTLGQVGTYLGFQGLNINDAQAVAVPKWRNYRYIGIDYDIHLYLLKILNCSNFFNNYV